MPELNFDAFTCPLPISQHDRIVMGHGSGGKMTSELIERLFLPLFDNPHLAKLDDQAVLDFSSLRLAFTTDSYVVSPVFFPGGDIGRLAVNGTINDLAMSGARPLYLSAGFILEEGLALADLARIAASMRDACQAAGVTLVTGDTKVVNKGSGDQIFINTSGIGLVPDGVNISANQARPGDRVIVSGPIGVHGIAIMSVRAGIEFETQIESDTAPLHGLVQAMLEVTPRIHCLRDPTRGGLASTLNELAQASRTGIVIDEQRIPIPPEVRAACEILGLDPLYVANEGKLVAIVPPDKAEAIVARMRAHPYGHEATVIGGVVAEHPRMVVMKTRIGGTRVVDKMAGEILPRIC